MQIDSPQVVASAYVYRYHFIDDSSFIRDPREVFYGWATGRDQGPKNQEAEARFEQLIKAVRDRFASEGWEGDGRLGIIWLPCFVDSNAEDGYGNYLWHVKQDNNGTSWLMSAFPLSFGPLLEQNH